MPVNPVILKRDIDKWNKLTASIKRENLDQSTDETKAFNILVNAFKGTFNKTESEKLINNIKDNTNKYASNRDLQAELKDFATICTLWLTKTEVEFSEFKKALNPSETKVVVEDEKSGKEDTKQINSILLNRDVEKFRKLCFSLNGAFESLDVDDQSAFEILSKYYSRKFDRVECEELINGVKDNLNKYSSNRDLQANLKDFVALCTIWYTKTDYEFTEFKKAMGGKEHKPIVVENKKHEKKEEKKTNQKTIERIDYNNGDYYIGELLNGKLHGKGKYYWVSGDWYDGDWLDGVQYGNGVNYILQYERTDTGTYKGGERFGSGKMVWANGSWYVGDWNKNGASGKGTYYHREMQRTDIGDFVNSDRNGHGVMKWDNGNRYEGTWKDTANGLDGEGIYYSADGYSEHGRYVKGNWQPLHSNDYNTNTYDDSKTYDGNTSQNAGAWIWNNLMWFPWGITALWAIITLITDGFGWSLIGICIGGGIVSYIMMFVIEILKSILKWFWNRKWIMVVIVLLIVLRAIYASDFVQNLFTNAPSIEQPVLLHQPNYYCNATELNIRSTPSANGKIIGKMKKGDEVYVYPEDITGGFAKIEYKGNVAYVHNKYITKTGEVVATDTPSSVNAADIQETTSAIQPEETSSEPEQTENNYN